MRACARSLRRCWLGYPSTSFKEAQVATLFVVVPLAVPLLAGGAMLLLVVRRMLALKETAASAAKGLGRMRSKAESATRGSPLHSPSVFHVNTCLDFAVDWIILKYNVLSPKTAPCSRVRACNPH